MVQPLPRQKPVNCGAAGGIAAQDGIAVIERGVAAIVGAAGKACAEQGGEVIRGGCASRLSLSPLVTARARECKKAASCVLPHSARHPRCLILAVTSCCQKRFLAGSVSRKLRACRGKPGGCAARMAAATPRVNAFSSHTNTAVPFCAKAESAAAESVARRLSSISALMSFDGHGVALVRFHNKLFAARADVRGVADDHASVGHNPPPFFDESADFCRVFLLKRGRALPRTSTWYLNEVFSVLTPRLGSHRHCRACGW